MKPKLFCISMARACAALQAHAVGSLADVTVVDRDAGATLPLHHYRGKYWVAGKPGAHYSISARNRTGERIIAVPAVDGVNVLSGETAGWGQTGQPRNLLAPDGIREPVARTPIPNAFPQSANASYVPDPTRY